MVYYQDIDLSGIIKAGTGNGGLIFKLENNKVLSISAGAAAE